MNYGQIETVHLAVSSCAVNTAGTINPATLNVGVYKANYGSRTLLGTLAFSINDPNVNNNLSISTFQISRLSSIDFIVNRGDIIGCEFISGSGNSTIASVNGMDMRMIITDGEQT